jgi:metal-responsive CopG/Arc/MetJ family transcriptional regulator
MPPCCPICTNCSHVFKITLKSPPKSPPGLKLSVASDKIIYLNERQEMLSTALAIQTATKDAVHDEEVMGMASAIFHHRNEMSDEAFAQAMYMYSAHLSAMTATLVTHACLTESQIGDMLETIKEFDSLGKDITNGN